MLRVGVSDVPPWSGLARSATQCEDARMARAKAPDLDLQFTLRLSTEMLERARTLARALSKPPRSVTTSEVLRYAVTRGLDALQKEQLKP